ncbi:hypothetical protein L9F63_024232 [Diploptera punctata]|uniref:Uncharacterized protein n=1 Tax=Diploptera punctata TaxID=6984 RepID=A0AAD7ZHM1_DIPPU|nr:hypothetical protein L9F63_024232 [Diploptera punctata]
MDSVLEELVSEDEDGIAAVGKVEYQFDATSNVNSDDAINTNRKVIYGKNGSKWLTKPFQATKSSTRQENKVIQLPGP